MLQLELKSKIMPHINFPESLLENFAYINCFVNTLEKGLVKRDLMNFSLSL